MLNIDKQRMQKILQALNYVFKMFTSAIIVILVIIGIFLLYYVISAKVISKQAGTQPFISIYTIISPSMAPNINVYDIIIDKKVSDPAEIKVGDIITFISTSSLTKDWTVTHRVVDIKIINGLYEYTTKGDGNPTVDSAPAPYENVIGKVIMKVPLIGKLQLFLATKMGWIIIVLLPALGVIIYDVMKILKIIKTNKSSTNININPDAQKIMKLNDEKQINETMKKIANSGYLSRLGDITKKDTEQDDNFDKK